MPRLVSPSCAGRPAIQLVSATCLASPRTPGPRLRLGDWPPATVRDWDQARLAGAIARFTAIWGRLLDVWFGAEPYLQFDDERLESLLLLGLLVPEPMLATYAHLSPTFWSWVRGDETTPAARG